MKKNWPRIAEEMPDEVLKSEYAKRYITGRKPVLKPCPHCGKEFSARDMRAHVPKCPKKPKVTTARKAK